MPLFKADGTTLTGTVNDPRSGEAAIKDGKMSGTDFKTAWKGKIAGDGIEFTRGAQGGAAMEILAKRAKLHFNRRGRRRAWHERAEKGVRDGNRASDDRSLR